MNSNKHTLSDLHQMQGLSLDLKIKMTKRRILEWDEYWGGCTAVSFSGGKDSTVLLHIARQVKPDMKAVFFDTGMELPSIRNFVRTFDNVDMIKPKMRFPQVLKQYGYPVVSKEVASNVYYAKQYIDKHREELEEACGGKACSYMELNAYAAKQSYQCSRLEDASVQFALEAAMLRKPYEKLSDMFNNKKWKFMLDAPFNISDVCCRMMKKSPMHLYEKEHGTKSIQAIIASESKRRASSWVKYGCNGFDMKSPRSIPMAFWTEQDVLAYIYKYKIPIADEYGKVIKTGCEDFEQLDLFDADAPVFETTNANRTGCYTCGFGIHRDKRPTRLERLEPKLRDVVLQGGRFEDGLWMPYKGFGFYFVYAWMNVYGGPNIIIPEEEKYYSALPDEAKEMLRKKG